MEPFSFSQASASPAPTSTLQLPAPALNQTEATSPRNRAEISSYNAAKNSPKDAARDLKTSKHAAETSAPSKIASPSAFTSAPMTSITTQVSPLQLHFLVTRRTSCKDLLSSKEELVERCAHFHRRLCDRLTDVERKQKKHQQWLSAKAKSGLSPGPEYPERIQYAYVDDTPLTTSQIELIEGQTGKDEDDGLFLRFTEVAEPLSKEAVSNYPEDRHLKEESDGWKPSQRQSVTRRGYWRILKTADYAIARPGSDDQA